ncbi:MAG: hypothetical protein WD851_16970 [Pirellulales bacterium]
MSALTQLSLVAQSASGMFSEIEPAAKAGLLFASLGALTLIVITFGCVGWNVANAMHRRRLEADLKRDMLDRGMTADEIAKVIESAAPPESGVDRWVASWGKNKKA